MTTRSPLKKAYAVSTNDDWLKEEKLAALRTRARQSGFGERRVLALEESDALLAAVRNSSLFSPQVLIEVRCRQEQLTKEHENFLIRLLEDISSDTLLLISLPYLPTAQRKKKWVQLLKTKGELLVLYTPQGKDWETWLHKRAQKLNLAIHTEALALIAEKNSGNLSAAAQELEKLKIYYGDKNVSYTDLLAAISDDSHYESFSLSDNALKGNVAACKRALRHLQAERVPPYLLIGILARDLRSLWALSNKATSYGVPFRQSLLRSALPRLQENQRLLSLLMLAARADRAAKGGSNEDVWQLLEGLSLRIAGLASPASGRQRNPGSP